MYLTRPVARLFPSMQCDAMRGRFIEPLIHHTPQPIPNSREFIRSKGIITARKIIRDEEWIHLLISGNGAGCSSVSFTDSFFFETTVKVSRVDAL